METIYLTCAIVGGTLLACQLLLSLLGLGGHHDLDGHDFHDGGATDPHAGTDHAHEGDHDDQASWFAGVLTLRAIMAAVTLFGLVGLAGMSAWGELPITHLTALAAGGGALFLVAWVMQSLYRLRAEGTVRIERALGKSGTVYLSIPGAKAGVGKVHLNVQNRTAEYQAITAHRDLPTGAKVVVVAVLSSDTVEVAPASDSERVTHG